MEVVLQRLRNQRLASQAFKTPHEVVSWFGAVQAQDYLGSLWAVGLRIADATEQTVEQAIADGAIVRTWPQRGTLHYVAAEDIRWFLGLTAPRMLSRAAGRYRELGLDTETFDASRTVLTRALRGGKRLTRGAIYQLLAEHKIAPDGQRGIHILGWLSVDGTLCIGPREGKQQTFVLLDEWAPKTRTLSREEALAEVATRYFTSHGPASLQDFIWWTGLTVAEAKQGIELAGSALVSESVDSQTYWLSPATGGTENAVESAHLLPAYDEFTVAYKDRSAIIDPEFQSIPNISSAILNPTFIVNGQALGAWKRTIGKDAVVVSLQPFGALTGAERDAIEQAAERYGKFLGLPVRIA